MPPPKVAVINDDTQFLHMMEIILTEAGYDVLLQVESGAAFDTICSWQPDLVILDIRLDHPDAGWTILDMMRLDRATEKTPVIVCSAAHEELQAKADHLEKYRCRPLYKPFNIDQLVDIVREEVGPPE